MSKLLAKIPPNLKLQSILAQNSRSRSSSPKMSTESTVNILIVFNDSHVTDNGSQYKTIFDSMKASITQMTGPNKYTIYNINAPDIHRTDSWHLTTALVITIGDQLVDKCLNSFGGKHVNFRLKDLLNGVHFNGDYFKRQLSGYLKTGDDDDLNSGLKGLDLSDTSATKAYLITKDTNDSFVENNRHLFSKIRLIDESGVGCDAGDEDAGGCRLDLTINANFENISFDTKTYYSHLRTERLGQWLAFAERTDTTMNLIESFAGIDGFTAVTTEQTKGRGRTQNEWLSPKGCAMFTVQLTVDLNSNIGRKMAFIQHLCGLSVVRAVKTKPGYEGLDLVLKWPNDILWRKTRGKVCGMIVTTTSANRSFNVLIGIGINVSNREPALCINHIIDDHNSVSNRKLDYLSCEEVIARTLTQMEELLKTCEQTNGLDIIEDMYIKQWIHSDEVIKLMDSDGERVVRIEGLDRDGYLLVKELSTGSALSLHPDGNRFDIMRNLMIPRKLT